MKSEPKKEIHFGLSDLLGVGFTLVVVGVGIAFGLDIVGDIRDDFGADNCAARTDTYTSYNVTAQQCYNSTGNHVAVGTGEFNATTDTVTGLGKITAKIPTLATVVVASVIIGVLVTYLWARFAK